MEISRKQIGIIVSLVVVAIFVIGFPKWGMYAFETFPERLAKVAPFFNR